MTVHSCRVAFGERIPPGAKRYESKFLNTRNMVGTVQRCDQCDQLFLLAPQGRDCPTWKRISERRARRIQRKYERLAVKR